jgi:hypothetical protein
MEPSVDQLTIEVKELKKLYHAEKQENERMIRRMSEAEKELRMRDEQMETMKKSIIDSCERKIQELELDCKEQIKETQSECQEKLGRERFLKGRGAFRDREISEEKSPDYSFVDHLAPYGVYGGFKQEHDDRVDLEQCKKREEMFSSQRKFTDGPSRPKMSTFDGKADWRPFYAQFSHIANRYK